MKRLCSLALVLAAAAPARAHFVWILPPGGGESKATAKPAEDPAATKLLADARAARASWHNFPGFSADVEVNFDGAVTKGRVAVDDKGKVSLEMPDGDART